MDELWLKILSVIIAIIVIPLITMIGKLLINFIKSKIGNNDFSLIIEEIINLIVNTVNSILNEYNQNQKIDSSKIEEIISTSISKILSELSEEHKNFISVNYGNLETWLFNQINLILKNSL